MKTALVPTPLTRGTRWVVKIGSALLTNDGKGLDLLRIEQWAAQIAELKLAGIEVVLVSSGAVAAGMSRLGWTERPGSMELLQAAAAVGQTKLVQTYEDLFQPYGLHTAQILLTHDDLSDRKRYLNARNTLRALLAMAVIPIVNENDTVTTDEIKVGDNDTLGALVANLVEADALILLTDQDGLFDADPRQNPHATLIRHAQATDPALVAVAGSGGKLGRGGMATKIRAAQLAARSGAVTVIAGGRIDRVLTRLRAGESVGTYLEPDLAPLVARKQWLAGHLQMKGELVIDSGAARALLNQGKSLLAVGVVSVKGSFQRGECVAVKSEQGLTLARGLVNYDAQDAAKIVGQSTQQIKSLLGFINEPELIHRDNLVVL
ncbi:MAG: glutamate 5-kinase [Reinekea forsetii]|uniref:Glutamate 5-kinase n=1 Tax=Reinekea forsetii TaxID=1336806 RepID=A0A2K8KS31_9GAMM|nr:MULTISPECIES: glutamate 5-kinase [Reinekea]ATX77540.1 glutamate 5-kinase / RNA-binding protein C-terminal domain protein PUA [Reinekea forsetii]MDO7642966.1 glutamate 5-kinase [Reinekea forsetii]MDO7674387.1 glutamate 5-kinase [Reinekea forsetii]